MSSPLSSLLVPGCRLGVVGSRDFPFPSLVESFVVDLPEGVCIVSGGSGVVDLTAASSGRSVGLEVEEFFPNWGRFRKGAGPERNGRLVRSGLSVLVVFVNDPERPSRGSLDCLRQALKIGVPVFVFGPDGSSPSVKLLF